MECVRCICVFFTIVIVCTRVCIKNMNHKIITITLLYTRMGRMCVVCEHVICPTCRTLFCAELASGGVCTVYDNTAILIKIIIIATSAAAAVAAPSCVVFRQIVNPIKRSAACVYATAYININNAIYIKITCIYFNFILCAVHERLLSKPMIECRECFVRAKCVRVCVYRLLSSYNLPVAFFRRFGYHVMT